MASPDTASARAEQDKAASGGGEVIDIGRFEGRQLVEHWGVPDRLGVLEQLGGAPRPERTVSGGTPAPDARGGGIAMSTEANRTSAFPQPEGATRAARDNPGVIAPPPLLYLGPLVLGVLLNRIHPIPLLPPAPAALLGGALLAGGVALNVWFIATMKRARTPIDPRQPVARLITGGPFRLSRNPSYTAFTLTYLGVACLIDTAWPLLWLPAVLLVMQRGVIAREERYLERAFGEEYRRYRARVRRWL